MTREEIEELKGLAASMGLYDDKNPCKRAMILGKAIKVLKQEPCEDAISRQAAIDAFERFIHELGIEDEPYNYGEIALSIQNVPPVTPQPKTGHWIFVDKAHEHAHCSECDYGDVDLMDGRPHNYCPNCGAKMVEPQESEG